MERELWKLLYEMTRMFGKPWGSWKYSTRNIVATYFWAVVNDRPTSWAADPTHWPTDLCQRRLPSQPTLSRRMRRPDAQELMCDIENAWLALWCVSRLIMVRIIDGKPLPVSNVTKDKDAGFGRGAGGMQKGYKLYAVWSDGPLPFAWALAPMNCSEKKMAEYLIADLPGGGYLLGDSEYDSNKLYDLAHAAGYQLLVRKRQKKHGVGHRPQSPYRLRSIDLLQGTFGKTVYQLRRTIERTFGNLVSFGGGLICLPAWVRRFTRVRNWVHAKLLINAARWFLNNPLTAVA